ncbi:hypothetical protein IF650_16725 [Cellulosimicrobium terreum]|nr:hypothetical protein [Cellulosimicrobium terreum]
MLLAAFAAPRPTRDIDLAASGLPNDVDDVERRVREIVTIDVVDGLEFVTDGDPQRDHPRRRGLQRCARPSPRRGVEGADPDPRRRQLRRPDLARAASDVRAAPPRRRRSVLGYPAAIKVVADHRHVALRSLAETLEGMSEIAQVRWVAWRRKQRSADSTPERFHTLLDEVEAFADPILGRGIDGLTWHPRRGPARRRADGDDPRRRAGAEHVSRRRPR